jgi:methylenetetrahydrofolate--tRNA-(uracil-5-)-methyltransferase
VLKATYQFKARPDLFFAGQMTGVEGYVESAASGLVAGVNAARFAQGEEPLEFPVETAMGSMAKYITSASADHFQPMNANFGLFPELPVRIKAKQERNLQYANRALETIQNFAKVL